MAAFWSMLDPWLYRHPFEGASARRYARLERSAFADLDARLLDAWDTELRAAASFLEVGCGPATLAARLAGRYPAITVLALDPSRDFTARARADLSLLRARAESLPVADATISVAACLSSIRHVRDRAAALRELRRVVRPGGSCYIVELDPLAPRARARQHSRGLKRRWLRLAFTPLVLRTAPRAATIAALARAAGWDHVDCRDDSQQPVYVMRLS